MRKNIVATPRAGKQNLIICEDILFKNTIKAYFC